MVKDANLEVRMYDIDGMSRLFAKMSIPVWEGIKKVEHATYSVPAVCA